MSAAVACAHCQWKVREVIFCVVCGEWCCVHCYRAHLRTHQLPPKTPSADVEEKLPDVTNERRKETVQAA
jgi:hypothetical protein